MKRCSAWPTRSENVWTGGSRTGVPAIGFETGSSYWQWDNGDPWTFENWSISQPDNAADENVFAYGNGHISEGQWADGNSNSTMHYCIEYTVVVPVESRTWGAIKALYE